MEELAVPRSQEQFAAYIVRFFEEYDELSRQTTTGNRKDPGPIPSELIFDLLEADRYEEAWQLIALLVDAAPTDEALGFIAAAALEELICYSVPPDLVLHEIIERARVDAKLRRALGLMYWDGARPWFRSEVKALGIETC